MMGQALLSPQSAYRWMYCPPSARLGELVETKYTEVLREEAIVRALAEYKVKRILRIEVDNPQDDKINEEMELYTEVYADFIREIIEKAEGEVEILVSERIDVSNYAKNSFGICDFILVDEGGTVFVVSFKYENEEMIFAENNPELALFALGALNIFDDIFDIKKISMTVVQPRVFNISTFEMDKEQLIAYGKTQIKPRGDLAFFGGGELLSGEYCTLCNVKNTCKLRAGNYFKARDFDLKEGKLLTHEEIEEVLGFSEELSSWLKEIVDYATELATTRGEKWTGFKLVEGRASRKYKDEKEVVKICEDNGINDIYSKSLLSITAMERLIGKNNFNRILGDLVEKKEGKLTLVKNSDRRKEVRILGGKGNE